MALVLLRDENEGRDKHVESTLFPRLDEGSIPSSSTKKTYSLSKFFLFKANLFYFVTQLLHFATISAHLTYFCANQALYLAHLYYFCATNFHPNPIGASNP